VLLVDDEEQVRDVTKRLLEKAGLAVQTATNGHEAVLVFREQADEIGCVVLDLIMDGMSAKETLLELRGIRDDVRVILSSGYTEPVAMDEFADEDLVGFIHKPYKQDALISKVKQALAM